MSEKTGSPFAESLSAEALRARRSRNPNLRNTFATVFSRGEDKPLLEHAKTEKREFMSHADLKRSMTKQERSRTDPVERAEKPLTESQEIGWQSRTFTPETYRKPRQSTPITQYTEAMILGPRHF